MSLNARLIYKAPKVTTRKKKKEMPEWNPLVNDLSKYQLSKQEMIKKKISTTSVFLCDIKKDKVVEEQQKNLEDAMNIIKNVKKQKHINCNLNGEEEENNLESKENNLTTHQNNYLTSDKKSIRSSSVNNNSFLLKSQILNELIKTSTKKDCKKITKDSSTNNDKYNIKDSLKSNEDNSINFDMKKNKNLLKSLKYLYESDIELGYKYKIDSTKLKTKKLTNVSTFSKAKTNRIPSKKENNNLSTSLDFIDLGLIDDSFVNVKKHLNKNDSKIFDLFINKKRSFSNSSNLNSRILKHSQSHNSSNLNFSINSSNSKNLKSSFISNKSISTTSKKNSLKNDKNDIKPVEKIKMNMNFNVNKTKVKRKDKNDNKEGKIVENIDNYDNNVVFTLKSEGEKNVIVKTTVNQPNKSYVKDKDQKNKKIKENNALEIDSLNTIISSYRNEKSNFDDNKEKSYTDTDRLYTFKENNEKRNEDYITKNQYYSNKTNENNHKDNVVTNNNYINKKEIMEGIERDLELYSKEGHKFDNNRMLSGLDNKTFINEYSYNNENIEENNFNDDSKNESLDKCMERLNKVLKISENIVNKNDKYDITRNYDNFEKFDKNVKRNTNSNHNNTNDLNREISKYYSINNLNDNDTDLSQITNITNPFINEMYNNPNPSYFHSNNNSALKNKIGEVTHIDNSINNYSNENYNNNNIYNDEDYNNYEDNDNEDEIPYDINSKNLYTKVQYSDVSTNVNYKSNINKNFNHQTPGFNNKFENTISHNDNNNDNYNKDDNEDEEYEYDDEHEYSNENHNNNLEHINNINDPNNNLYKNEIHHYNYNETKLGVNTNKSKIENNNNKFDYLDDEDGYKDLNNKKVNLNDLSQLKNLLNQTNEHIKNVNSKFYYKQK